MFATLVAPITCGQTTRVAPARVSLASVVGCSARATMIRFGQMVCAVKSLSQKVWHGFATRVLHRLETGSTGINGIGS